MTDNTEAFHGALVFPVNDDTPPLIRHDINAMQSLVDEGFGQELATLAHGCPLDRPTGESYETPAETLFGVSRVKAREANRTSSNDHVASLALQGGEIAYSSTVDIQRKRSAGDVLSKRSFTEGSALTRWLLSTPKALRTFRAQNMYSDMGKTEEVLAWANTIDELKGSNDHDVIVATLIQPEHEAARRRFMPSFDTLEPDQQKSIRAMIGCNFHLPQLNNGQSITRNLEKFYELTQEEKRILLAQEVFDIAGAQGDTVANGTGTITESMYRRLRGQIKILLSEDNAHLPPAERAQDDYNQILAFHAKRFDFRDERFRFDLENPNDPLPRTMVRFGTMFRDLSNEQIREIPDIFDKTLEEVTKAHIVDFMCATGYESEGQGAIMSTYSSTAAALLLKKCMGSGNTFKSAMKTTMQFIARLNSAARRTIDITDAPVTNVVARDLVAIAEKDWTQLVRHEIVARRTGPGQAHFALKYQPTVTKDRDSRVASIASPHDLHLPTSGGWWFAGGGGGDIYTDAFLARDVFGQEDPTLFSVWGEPHRIVNAAPIGRSGRIFEASAETRITGTRSMEHLVAARGLKVMIVCLDKGVKGNHLVDDFRRIADHLPESPSHVALVDTGGDILAPSTLTSSSPDRDHLSFEALRDLHAQLGNIPAKLLVALPGADAPESMDSIAQRAEARVLDLAPYGQTFVDLVQQDGLMTNHPLLYSRMIQSLYYALHPRTLAKQDYREHPLLLPVDQALKRKRARPAFTPITPQMRELHIYELEKTAQMLGI